MRRFTGVRRAEDCAPYLREASWSAPVLWRFDLALVKEMKRT
jgi:hypothetical protein